MIPWVRGRGAGQPAPHHEPGNGYQVMKGEPAMKKLSMMMALVLATILLAACEPLQDNPGPTVVTVTIHPAPSE